MTIDMQNLLNSILASFERIEYIKTEDIPNIDLYMDQVTTFMDSRLRKSTRNPGDDKILTKTMINNYTKNDLLPPPIKKKYSKEHVLLLIFIYYFKGILSINDIQTLLNPLAEKFFRKGENYSLEDIYNEVFSLEEGYVEILKQDVIDKFKHSGETFCDAPEKDKLFLQQFSFICMLSFDVYMKKLLIEKMIDGMVEKKSASATAAKADKKQNEKQDSEKKASEKKGSEKKTSEKKAKQDSIAEE